MAQKEALEKVVADLSQEKGLPVALEGQPVEVVTGAGGLEVANPTNLAGVEAAVHEGTDTANQNVWAIAGLFVGFGLLVVVWKLVRP